MSYELLIQHGTKIMYPPVVEGVTIEWERQGQPGKLTFEVVKTDGLSFQEGDPCRFSVDGTPMFYGFVFEKSRKGSNPNVIKCTVYDQLYYLKNKDTYVYSNKTAAEVIRMIAEDFQLNVGGLEDTGYKIASRVEDNQTLFDIIQNALDETLKATKQMYVLYDAVGKLTLKNIGSMKLGLLIDEDTAGDYDYKSSIASQTYDKIKLAYENKDTGVREIYIAQDGSSINQWGVLQYYEKLDNATNAKAMADALLSLYNTKTRTLKLQDVLGDVRVRAGTLLVVMLGLGDINVSNFLMVEQVKHSFKDGQHLMELKMRGGTFVT
ncbi:MAG: hydrolase [Oscillospiraceae bacterium]|nr:hydrolase [Oscillospiraceae bacterium]